MEDLGIRALEGIDCAVVVAGSEGEVLFANNRAAALFGRDLTGVSLAEGSFEDDLPLVCGVVESYRRAVPGRETCRDLLISVEEQETRYYWIAVSPAEGAGAGEGPRILMLQDITEPLSRSAVVRKVFSQVNHDLRSPLTSIAGAAELLLTGRVGAMDEAQRRLVRIIEEGARKMNEILARTKGDLARGQQAAGGDGVE